MALQQALADGYACLAAWSDLVDSINVFPVADGDTGANLRISLAPLQDTASSRQETIARLGRAAIGNSGNIAVAFFRPFAEAETVPALVRQATIGRAMARQAVAAPRDGTMLTLFDALAAGLAGLAAASAEERFRALRTRLRQAVLAGCQSLPELERAGVVDAGALAMFLFFDAYFAHLAGRRDHRVPVCELFAGRLAIRHAPPPVPDQEHCIEATLRHAAADPLTALSDLGHSLVRTRNGAELKLHIHTTTPGQVQARLEDMGQLTGWSDEIIDSGRTGTLARSGRRRRIHIVTDAAGSMPRALARKLGITLLDSSLVINGCCRPESLWPPDELYRAMRNQHKVTTAQAPLTERGQRFDSLCQRFACSLYLCVGSAFSGTCQAATEWQRRHDPDNRLTVMDTGAASGRLGLIALLTARYADQGQPPEQVIARARELTTTCREYVFIDQLRYLAAGGRMPKLAGLVGDLLHMKPVVSPMPEGVRRLGLVRSQTDQVRFALARIEAEAIPSGDHPILLLQYTDNADWVRRTVLPRLRHRLPKAEIHVLPLSLTAGAHMGPGTWALAWAPQQERI